jgi:hypothetical protein
MDQAIWDAALSPRLISSCLLSVHGCEFLFAIVNQSRALCIFFFLYQSHDASNSEILSPKVSPLVCFSTVTMASPSDRNISGWLRASCWWTPAIGYTAIGYNPFASQQPKRLIRPPAYHGNPIAAVQPTAYEHSGWQPHRCLLLCRLVKGTFIFYMAESNSLLYIKI